MIEKYLKIIFFSLIMFFPIFPIYSEVIDLWDPQKIYVQNDKVKLDNNIFIAKWWTRGDKPQLSTFGPWDVINMVVPENNTNNEKVIYENWDPDKIYVQGNRVNYLGTIYESQWWNTSERPDLPVPYPAWKEIEVTIEPVYNVSSENTIESQNEVTENLSDDTVEPELISIVDDPIEVNNDVTVIENTNASDEIFDSANENEPTTVVNNSNQDNLLIQETQTLSSEELLIIYNDSMKLAQNEVVESVIPLSPMNPDNVKRVERILSSDSWDYLFPVRNLAYTYSNFLKAVAKFTQFCKTHDNNVNSDYVCRKHLTVLFAHMVQETGMSSSYEEAELWRQGLFYLREIGWDENSRNGYNDECSENAWQSQVWPCGRFSNGDFKSFYGRGAKQLSYNYNYGQFSKFMFNDVSVLLNSPELVADSWLNLSSAIFFYMNPQPPKPSIYLVVEGVWKPNSSDLSRNLKVGFGVTTQIINGGVECNKGEELSQSLSRISYYESFANFFGVTINPEEKLNCADMLPFNSEGAASVNIFWDRNYEDNSAEQYSCKLVSYQTAFTSLIANDYNECIEFHFGTNINPNNPQPTDNSDETNIVFSEDDSNENDISSTIDTSFETGELNFRSNIILASNNNINYIGRWNRSDLQNPTTGWGATGIKAKFTGTSITVLLDDDNRWDYRINGGEWLYLNPTGRDILANNLVDGSHTIELFRRNEGGTLSTFKGFILDENRILVEPDPRSNRKIIFIGDSISAGYGCECNLWGGCNLGPTNDNSNANKAWPARTARLSNADFQVIARSGAGLFMNGAGDLNDVLPIYYNQTEFAWYNPGIWDFDFWENPSVPDQSADLIVIMLGTNDFSTYGKTTVPTKFEWKSTMNNFIDRLKLDHPNSKIMLIGTLYGRATPDLAKALDWNNEIVEDRGDDWLYSIDPSSWVSINPVDGDMMSDWTHPVCDSSSTGSGKISSELYSNYISPIMGW
ncbi:glycoside hydrolase family 19 protein [Paraphotobacterium marinum]|uniref:glycoside hydrolase family 19 protein n=1 Tax=Paraphotobacterium marinum TaxID=1755811 RepID=UPI0039E99FED